MTRPDATDLFKALEAGLCEGTPTLTLQNGHIWIDGETSFDARSVIAHLLALAKPGADVPERWILVPREATEAMVEAADDANADYRTINQRPDAHLGPEGVYRAMIAAAPPPPAAEPHDDSRLSGSRTQEVDFDA